MNRRPTALLVAVGLLAAAPLSAQRIAEVQIAPPFLRMVPDAQTSVLPTAYDTDGNPVVTTFTWSSSNINVVQVNDEGLIRAVAPGTAIVTAAVDAGGVRRRIGRITVFVVPPGRVTVRSVPMPVAPPAPATPAPGETPRVGAPEPPRRFVNVDSAIRASVDCTEPTINAVNPMRVCWETRAVPREPPDIPVPATCESFGPVRPTTIQVRVGEQGTVEEVRPFAPSNCPQFTELAIARLREATFTPARQNGRPIASWVLIRVHPRR